MYKTYNKIFPSQDEILIVHFTSPSARLELVINKPKKFQLCVCFNSWYGQLDLKTNTLSFCEQET